jgi:hypothetical protein
LGEGQQPIMMPKGVDPNFFVDQGLADRGDPARILLNLGNFGQGGAWDLQRPGNPTMKEFRDAASVAIGLYGAAAGINPHHVLTMQSLYALLYSRFDDKTILPIRFMARCGYGT